MGWSIGYDDKWNRDIGYGVPAWCDHPGCDAEIDRGLSYVCGGEPYGGDEWCGLYFCYKHLYFSNAGKYQVCARCEQGHRPFNASQDHPRWLCFKANDPSWKEWRAEHPTELRDVVDCAQYSNDIDTDEDSHIVGNNGQPGSDSARRKAARP